MPRVLQIARFLPLFAALLSFAFMGRAQTDPPGKFTYVSGRWTEGSGVLSQADAPARALALQPGAHEKFSARVEARLSGPERGAEAGLVFHALDGDNYLLLVLERKKAGVYVSLKTRRSGKPGGYITEEGTGDQAPVEVNPSQWQELRADVDGPHVAGYLNGRPVVSFSFLGKPPQWYAHPAVWPTDLTGGRVGAFSRNTTAQFRKLEIRDGVPGGIYTPYRPRLDAFGRMLPHTSYAKMLTGWTRWNADSTRYTDYRDAPPEVREWPAYLLSSFVFSNDLLGTDIQYPGHNHPPAIEGYVRMYLFDGDRRWLQRARELADWNIAHATPANWAVPNLTLSHFDYHKHVATLDALGDSGFEPDKSAYQGLAYLLLYGATEDRKYLDAAVRTGDTLARLQRPDGGFPFRVRPRDGKVLAPYTASITWYVRFFEELARFTGEARHRETRDRAFRWMMENPVKTKNWQGFYGDIATGAESYDQWTALDAAMYLLERRDQDPSYEPIALDLVKWVEGKLVVKDGFAPGVPAILEQTSYPVILSIHTGRLAEVYARLWGATGDARYKQLAEQIANTITWLQMSDGKMRAGLWWHAWGTATSSIIFNEQFLRIMAEIPETAPRHGSHLLFHTGYVRDVSYSPARVSLHSWQGGEARLSLGGTPAALRDAEGVLPELRALASAQRGWVYDPEHHFLRARYRGKTLDVDLR